jgi:hypothetical protein
MKITPENLDYVTRILADTKKHIGYDKGAGLWHWVDRDCIENQADYHCGFKTWWDAATDAVEPYLNGAE